MNRYYHNTKKHASALGLTSGFLWLIGGLLGVYYFKGNFSLFLSALIIGGLPIITVLIASKLNILGALLLIAEAVTILFITYYQGIDLLIILLLFLTYSFPVFLSGTLFIKYWYKNKIRI
jgi:hypothetical protein